MENDEALGVRSRVQAIQPRVSRENWAVEHVATITNIEERGGGGRTIKQKMSLLAAQNYHLMRRENLKSESSVL